MVGGGRQCWSGTDKASSTATSSPATWVARRSMDWWYWMLTLRSASTTITPALCEAQTSTWHQKCSTKVTNGRLAVKYGALLTPLLVCVVLWAARFRMRTASHPSSCDRRCCAIACAQLEPSLEEAATLMKTHRPCLGALLGVPCAKGNTRVCQQGERTTHPCLYGTKGGESEDKSACIRRIQALLGFSPGRAGERARFGSVSVKPGSAQAGLADLVFARFACGPVSCR